MFLTVPPLLLKAGINHLLRHPWQLFLALVGISMGVALVLAVDIANSAAKASFAHSVEQIKGTATHRVVSALGSIDEDIYTRLFTQPGMPPIAPVITASVRIKGYDERFQLIGTDIMAESNFRRSLAGNLTKGPALDKWLSDPKALMISKSAAEYLNIQESESLQVSHKGNEFMLQVHAISELDTSSSRLLLFVDIATAQSIRAEGSTISYLDLKLDKEKPGDIQLLLPAGVELVDINRQTESTQGLSAAFELNLTAMSLLGMLVGIFLIFNAISFSIIQRRNLLGRLRSLGVTSAQLYQVIILEAISLAVIGTILGLMLGFWLGQHLTAIVSATISELYYEINAQAINVNLSSLVKASLVGIIGTLVAAWLPAMQASKTKPLTTLSRAAFEQAIHSHLLRLAITGLVLVLIGMFTAFLLPGGVVSGFIGLFIILIGMVLTIPMVLRQLGKVLSVFSVNLIWQMSVRDLDRHISRLATATAALVLAISTSVGIAIMVDSMRSTVADWLGDLLTGDLYIAPESYVDNAYLSEKSINDIIQLDGIDDYSLYRNFKIEMGGRKIQLVAARLSAKSRNGFEFIQGDKSQVWSAFDDGSVIISEPLAYRMRLSVNDPVQLVTRQGEKTFQVAGVFRDFASEHGRLFINHDTFQFHWKDTRFNTLAVFSSKLAPDKLQQLINRSTANDQPLMMTQSKDVIDESMAVFDRTFRITEVLRLLSILVAFIGIFSALMAVLLERKKEFAILRAIGLTQPQIRQLILLESVMLGLISAVIAVPTGLLMAWILTDVIQYRAFGWSMPFQISWEPVVIAILLGGSAALLAAIYPASVASRRNPAPLLRED